MKIVLIVGVGQLGFRHLQSLLTSSEALNVFVVDKAVGSLARAQKELRAQSRGHVVDFLTELPASISEIDFCVVATGASGRLDLLIDIDRRYMVKNWLIEKVLFQSPQEIQKAISKWPADRSNMWVNCPRRIWSFYQAVKENIDLTQPLKLEVKGNGWGLACNAIHFIDLWAYFISSSEYELDLSGLEPSVFDSKRPGFKEVYGEVVGISGDHTISMLCGQSIDNVDCQLTITNGDRVMHIHEMRGEVIGGAAFGRGDSIEIPFQSQLTLSIFESALKGDSPGLTGFTESCALHRPFISEMLSHFDKFGVGRYHLCPIT